MTVRCRQDGWLMQMVRNGKDAPVNPFPAVYSIAQHLDIIDGQQQDIHECWMGLKDILDEARHDNVSPFLYHRWC